MDDAVAHFSYDITALRLEYKTTCDASTHWRGGDPAEQQFLIGKKQEVFRALAEASFEASSGKVRQPRNQVISQNLGRDWKTTLMRREV